MMTSNAGIINKLLSKIMHTYTVPEDTEQCKIVLLQCIHKQDQKVLVQFIYKGDGNPRPFTGSSLSAEITTSCCIHSFAIRAVVGPNDLKMIVRQWKEPLSQFQLDSRCDLDVHYVSFTIEGPPNLAHAIRPMVMKYLRLTPEQYVEEWAQARPECIIDLHRPPKRETARDIYLHWLEQNDRPEDIARHNAAPFPYKMPTAPVSISFQHQDTGSSAKYMKGLIVRIVGPEGNGVYSDRNLGVVQDIEDNMVLWRPLGVQSQMILHEHHLLPTLPYLDDPLMILKGIFKNKTAYLRSIDAIHYRCKVEVKDVTCKEPGIVQDYSLEDVCQLYNVRFNISPDDPLAIVTEKAKHGRVSAAVAN